jgi:hypothetical protein
MERPDKRTPGGLGLDDHVVLVAAGARLGRGVGIEGAVRSRL